MPLPDNKQLTLALLYNPDMSGVRVYIGAYVPGFQTVFMYATLQTISLSNGESLCRFIVDEQSQGNKPIKRLLEDRRESLEQTSALYNDDDPTRALILERIDTAPQVWLEFQSAEWIIVLHDQARVHIDKDVSEQLGEVIQLAIVT